MFEVEETSKAGLQGGEICAVISSSSFVVMPLKRVGCEVSGGITGALYSYTPV